MPVSLRLLFLPPFSSSPLQALRGRKLPSGKDFFEGRPGAELPHTDFDKLRKQLKEKYGEGTREVDMMSWVMYPAVYDDWMKFTNKFGDVSVIPTRYFVAPMKLGEEIFFEIEQGKTLFIKLKLVGEVSARAEGERRRGEGREG